MKITWSPRSLDRAKDISDYIAADSQDAARSWLDKLFAKVASQLRSPRSGRMVPEFGRTALREIIYGSYRVIYLVKSGEVEILTVRHSRRRMDPGELGQ